MDSAKRGAFTGKNLSVAFLFFIFAVLTRVCTFFPSVIDHDESTYIVIANELNKGADLYVDYWDTKPPGIFIVFSQILRISPTVLAIRLFTSIVIAFSALLIYRLKFHQCGKSDQSVFAGLLYMVMVSVHRWGWSANTELYFNLFTIASLWWITTRKGNAGLILAGIMMGMGMVVKYVVLFDAIAFVLLIALFNRNKYFERLTGIILYGIGILLPIGAVSVWFLADGNFDEMIDAVFLVSTRYPQGFDFLKLLRFAGEFHLVFSPVLALFYYELYWRIKSSRSDTSVLFILIWYCLAWIAVVIPGKFSFHYLMQVLLPVACFALDPLFRHEFKHRKKVLTASFIIMVPVLILLQYYDLYGKKNVRQEIFNYVKSNVTDSDVLFTNYKNILYFELDKSPPTPYVHTSLLIDSIHINALNIDVDSEYQRILERRPTKFVLAGIPKQFNHYLAMNCRRDTVFGNGVEVYTQFTSYDGR